MMDRLGFILDELVQPKMRAFGLRDHVGTQRQRLNFRIFSDRLKMREQAKLKLIKERLI